MFTAMLCGSLYCYSFPLAWCRPRSLSCIPLSYSDAVKELWAWVEAEPHTALLCHQVPHCPGSGNYNSWSAALCRFPVRCTWTVVWNQPLTLTPIPGTLRELKSGNNDANYYDLSNNLARARLVKTRHVTQYNNFIPKLILGNTQVIFLNFQNCPSCENLWRTIDTITSILRDKMLGYLSLDITSSSKLYFPRATLSENCSLLGIVAPTEGYCLFIIIII